MSHERSSDHDRMYWPHHHSGPWRGAPPWAIEFREMMRIVILNQGVQMAQSDDLNNAVTSLATAFEAEHVAVVAELDALALALANTSIPPDTTLSDAVTQAISNITHITGQMATDAAALTASIPAATTVPPPVVVEVPADSTATVPVIATPEVTAPEATPPSEPPADAITAATPDA